MEKNKERAFFDPSYSYFPLVLQQHCFGYNIKFWIENWIFYLRKKLRKLN